jgi:cell division protein FtsN
MPKDYAKFVPPKSRLHHPQKFPVILAAVVGLFLLAIVSAGVYFFTRDADVRADFYLKMTDLVHHKKTVAKDAQQVASAEAAKPQTVRFDFYEQLPNMQMPTDAAAIPSAPAPFVAPAPKLASIPAPTVAANPAPSRAAIFNPDELTHMLEAAQPKARPATVVTAVPQPASPHERFTVQMGEFSTDAAARGLLDAIKSVGFDARVVKISRSGRTIYQVQQGPYDSMVLATQAQQRMQKRGLISTIIKSI